MYACVSFSPWSTQCHLPGVCFEPEGEYPLAYGPNCWKTIWIFIYATLLLAIHTTVCSIKMKEAPKWANWIMQGATQDVVLGQWGLPCIITASALVRLTFQDLSHGVWHRLQRSVIAHSIRNCECRVETGSELGWYFLFCLKSLPTIYTDKPVL